MKIFLLKNYVTFAETALDAISNFFKSSFKNFFQNFFKNCQNPSFKLNHKKRKPIFAISIGYKHK